MNSSGEKRDHGKQPQLRTPRRVDSQKVESREYTGSMPLVPANAASIRAAQPVAHGAVPNQVLLCSQKMFVVANDAA